jgi:short-subunit dehydrogenase
MAQDLHGKRVLVTGASSGIGRAAAKAFVGAGASVVAVARSKERLDALAAELGGPPVAIPLSADVADGASMEALAKDVLARFGPPDVIVAGAGIGMDARFAETTDEAFRRVLEVNVIGVLRTIRPFLPAMVARGSGRILLISSVVGKRGVPNYSAYSASKFALHGMADALRPELHGTGVTVGIVCPSSTSTEFDDRKIRAGVPQPRVRVQRHTPESVAAALVRMARSTRREVVLSVEGKFMNWANRLAPGLLDIILAKALVKKRG